MLLSEAPFLTSPMYTNTIILETDASDIGIGSCLKRANEFAEEFIVNYKFSDMELRCNVVEKEAHAIITAIKKNRHVDTALEEDIHHIPRFPIDNSYVDVDELNIVENRLRIRR